MNENEKSSVNALESIVQTLEISDKQRADLITALRKLKLLDDNDPVIKMTLAIGLMTKLTSEIPEKLRTERLASIQEYRTITNSCNTSIAEISEFLKILEDRWNSSVERWEVKRSGLEKEFNKFTKDLNQYNEKFKDLIEKAESIQTQLCFVSFETIMTSAITALIIIVIFKLMRWI